MKIVDRKTFLGLPAGTFYAKGEPWAFGSLHIKGDTVADVDWYALDPCGVSASSSEEATDRLEMMKDHGASFPMEDAEGRDGLFDADAIFMIFEKDDLKILRDLIDAAISTQ